MLDKIYLFMAVAYLLIVTIFTFGSLGFTSFDKFNTAINLFEGGSYFSAVEILKDLPEDINGHNISSKKYFLLGSCYRHLKRWTEAIACYQRALNNKYIFSDYAIYHIAESYFELGKHQEALEWYEKLAREYPLYALGHKVLYKTAQCNFMLEDYWTAIKKYEKFVKNYPKHELKLMALYQIALSYQKLGKWRTAFWEYHKIIDCNFKHEVALEAIKRIEELLLKYPKLKIGRDEFITQGQVWCYHKEYIKARLKWEKAQGSRGSTLYAKTWYLIGDSFYAEKKFISAIDAYKKVLNVSRRNDYYAPAYYKLALSYQKIGKEERAIGLLRRFISRYPRNSYTKEMLYNLANYYKEKSLYKEAIKTYKELAERYPKSYLAEESIWRIGRCYIKLKKYYSSIRTYKHLIEKYPMGKYVAPANFWIGKCYGYLGKHRKACLNYALVINKENGYYSSLAKKYIEKVNKHKEVKSKTSSLSKNNIVWRKIKTANLDRARDLMELRIFDDALIELKSMIGLENIDIKSIYYNLAICYHKIGKYKESWHWAMKLHNKLVSCDDIILPSKELYSMLYPLNYFEFVSKYAKAYKLDPYLILAVIREESRYDPLALSKADARGLMQIIPKTGKNVAKKINIAFDINKLFIPKWNIKMGSWYLKELIVNYRGNKVLALAAYNGGPKNVDLWVTKYGLFDLDEFVENIPYKETREYVKRVMSSYQKYREIYLSSS
ncbi:MAG: tetratricopeptide repeat protein [bacterium]|nr:tetratricopeptide repeat protein [bacterium]